MQAAGPIGNSTYYKSSNIGVGYTEKDIINIFEHKIHPFK